MMPVIYKLPQITLTAGADVQQTSLSMKQLPLQSNDGKQLYLTKSKYRVRGTLTVAAATNVVRLARLFSTFRVRLEGLGFPLVDLDGRGVVTQGMVDRNGKALPQRAKTDTTVTTTYIDSNQDDIFAGLTSNGTAGTTAFDVTFEIDWAKKRNARDPNDYAWPAAVARCFETDLTVAALTALYEGGALITSLGTCTLDVIHELDPRNELQFPKIVSMSQQPLSGEEPTDITAFDGTYRSLVMISNAADYFAATAITAVQVQVGNVDLVPKSTAVRELYDAYNDNNHLPLYGIQDHTVPAAAAARRNQYLPLLAPNDFYMQRSTEQLDARAPVALRITDAANFKLLRSVEHNWNDQLLDHVISKSGLDPSQLTVKPVTASKKPAGGTLATRGLPFKVVGQKVDFTKLP